MNDNIIVVKELNKTYGNTVAVKKLNFTIKKNKIVGLLGPNGCGKTTTIAMILGLLKPTYGKIYINNKDIETNRIKLLEKMNFISPYIELPKKLTVKENLKVYAGLYGIQNVNQKIDELATELKLNEFLKKKYGELSSGQKNRVGLAKSLINNPEILLLDEPTASLDPEIGDFVRTFIESYSAKEKTTILLASHNMNEVERLCDSVMMMKKGNIIDQGTPNELILKHGRKTLEEVFLKIAKN